MINIPNKAKVKITWQDKPENYSAEVRNSLKREFAEKYGKDTKDIKVNFVPIRYNDKNEVIEIRGAQLDNVMDVNYQRALFDEYIKREKIEVDKDALLRLDDKVNSKLEIEEDNIKSKKWKINWLDINNFLTYGDENTLDYTKLDGITTVASTPKNMGGKTTLVVDAIKFLFFNKTTKTDKTEKIFNRHRDVNTVKVKGSITVDGEDYILERILKRSAKRSGDGYNVKHTLNYYRVLPDGTEENLNEEHAVKTTQTINDYIGKEEDFDIIVMATSDNLNDLIKSKPTERSKLFNKFVGLDAIEVKEGIVRDMFNQYQKKMKSNHYNLEDLTKNNETLLTEINQIKKNNEEIDENIKSDEKHLNEHKKNKEELEKKKLVIDDDVIKLNPERINREIQEITRKGVGFRDEMKGLDDKIKACGTIEFDEKNYESVNDELRNIKTDKLTIEKENTTLCKLIKDLTEGEICPTCKRKLDDVDHSKEIETNKQTLSENESKVNKFNGEIYKIEKELVSLKEIKEKVNEKNKLEIKKDALEVQIKSLRLDLKEKQLELKKYEANMKSIDFNKQIELDIINANSQITKYESDIKLLSDKKIVNGKDIDFKLNKIDENKNIIELIEKERDIVKVFKVYIEMIGKKGISKLILRSLLPIINSELARMLDEICDFDIEVRINDKNDIELVLIRDGVVDQLKSGSGFEKTASSVALRCVLGRITNLPTPNFIAFDEVMGAVSEEFLPNMKLVFDRVSEMYDNVFMITHIETVKDWSKNVINVVKENNVSTIS